MSNHRFSGDPNQYLGGHTHPNSHSHIQPHLSHYEQQHAIHPHYAQLSSASAVNGHPNHAQPHVSAHVQGQSNINVNSNVGSPSSMSITMMDNVNVGINSMHRRNQFGSASVPGHSLTHGHASNYSAHNHAHALTNPHAHPGHAAHTLANPHPHSHSHINGHPGSYSYHSHSHSHPMNGHSHPHGLIHASSSSLSTLSPSISNGVRPSPTNSTRNTARSNIIVHDHDVLSGRGVNIAQHPGNQRFRTLITTFRDQEYCTSYSAGEKRAVALQIIKHIKDLEPPGRFLKRDGRGQGSRGLSGPWDELSEREAIKKTCQALRDCNRQDRQGYAKGVAAPGDVIKIVEEASHIPAKERAAAAAHLIATEATNNAMNAISVAARNNSNNNSSIPNSIHEATTMVDHAPVYPQRRVDDVDNSSSVSASSRNKRSREGVHSASDVVLDIGDSGDVTGNMDGSVNGNVNANGANGENGNGSTCAGSASTSNMVNTNTNSNIISTSSSNNSSSNYHSPTSYYSAQSQLQQPPQPYQNTSEINTVNRFVATTPSNTILPNTANYHLPATQTGLHYQQSSLPYTSLQQHAAATSATSTHHPPQYSMNLPHPGTLSTTTAFTAGVPNYYQSSNPSNNTAEFILPMAAAQAPVPFQDAILSSVAGNSTSIHHNTYFNPDPYTNILNSSTLINADHQIIKKQRTEDTEPSTGPSEPSPRDGLILSGNNINSSQNKSSATKTTMVGVDEDVDNDRNRGGGGVNYSTPANYLDEDGGQEGIIADGSNHADSTSNNDMMVSNDCGDESLANSNERMEEEQQNDADSSFLLNGTVEVKIDADDEDCASENDNGSWVHGHNNHTSSIENDERFHDALGGF